MSGTNGKYVAEVRAEAFVLEKQISELVEAFAVRNNVGVEVFVSEDPLKDSYYKTQINYTRLG